VTFRQPFEKEFGMDTIREPHRQTPVCHECDVCVLGGSTTGVYAAVAAARLGARVALVEALGYFGGMATAALVNCWHTRFDDSGKVALFAGLITETVERLKRRDAVIDRGHHAYWQYAFNPFELVVELDELVREQSNIRPFLHTRFVAPVMEGPGHVAAAVIEDKTGRRAIRAAMFIDATGDGDLVHRAGFETYRRNVIQPPTTCLVANGFTATNEEVKEAVFDPRTPGALRPGFLWGAPWPGSTLRMIAGTRVHGADCSDADQLTRAEMEGRRQVRAMLDLARRHVPGCEDMRLAALPAHIGVRESRHARCLHQLTEREVLRGERFPDAIANGSYPVDVHAGDGDGLIFRHLDGREQRCSMSAPTVEGRWAPQGHVQATYYQVPYRCLVPRGSRNALAAGRCLDADEGAFGAVRVMVNTAQTGQAAGVAAWVALDTARAVSEIDTDRLRSRLAQQGAIVL